MAGAYTPRLALLAAPAVLASFPPRRYIAEDRSRGGTIAIFLRLVRLRSAAVAVALSPPRRVPPLLSAFYSREYRPDKSASGQMEKRAMRPTTRTFSANYQLPSLPKWLDKDCNDWTKKNEARALRVLFQMTEKYFFVCQFWSAVSSLSDFASKHLYDLFAFLFEKNKFKKIIK